MASSSLKVDIPPRVVGMIFVHLAAILFCAFRLNVAWLTSPDWPINPAAVAEAGPNGRSEVWLNSALDAQRNGGFLMVTLPDGRFPIEAISPATDLGIPCLAGMLAHVVSSTMTLSSLARINLCINAAGVLILYAIILMTGMSATAWVVLMAGAWLGIPGPVPSADATSSFFGATVFAAAAPVGAAIAVGACKPRNRRLGAAASVVSLAAATMLREAYALPSLLAMAWSWLGLARWPMPVGRLTRWAGLAVCSALAVGGPRAVVSLRDRLYDVSGRDHMATHGVSHALYLGLGTEPNRWNIRWDDRVAMAAVDQKSRGKAVFGTTAYYDVARSLYFDIVRRFPRDVASVYGRKAWRMLNLPVRLAGVPVFWVFGVSVLVMLALPDADRAPAGWILEPLSVYVMLLFVEGILIIPRSIFFYPLSYLMITLVATLMETTFRRPGADR
ncbi:MAG TPA: hypothetical protein VMU17_02620 [Elusimicrobiota bacterium]|nr:hypothetical protein [Elusimicrobiota bacterium]